MKRTLFFVIIICSIFICCFSRKNNTDIIFFDGPKDGSLIGLADFFNSNKEFFNTWIGSEKDYLMLFKLLRRWIIKEPVIKNIIKPILSLDCNSTVYENVFTGNNLKTPKFIIDFVPFGYDVDKLIVRLYETYDFVDLFIIYESTRTQSGMYKPLYFSLIKNNTIFRPFLNKIVHITSIDKDISYLIQRTRQTLIKKKKGEGYAFNDLWVKIILLFLYYIYVMLFYFFVCRL